LVCDLLWKRGRRGGVATAAKHKPEWITCCRLHEVALAGGCIKRGFGGEARSNVAWHCSLCDASVCERTFVCAVSVTLRRLH
jgi:hypothetical protein